MAVSWNFALEASVDMRPEVPRKHHMVSYIHTTLYIYDSGSLYGVPVTFLTIHMIVLQMYKILSQQISFSMFQLPSARCLNIARVDLVAGAFYP